MPAGRSSSAAPQGKRRSHGGSGPHRHDARRLQPQMSRVVEESNPRLRRARDAMDRDYSKPLDIRVLARIACLGHVLHPNLSRDLRRDTASLPAAPPRGASDVPATGDRPKRDRELPRCRLHKPRNLRPGSSVSRRPSTASGPRTCAPSPPASRSRGRDRAVSEKRAHAQSISVSPMLTRITHSQVYVLDQDEPLEFYVGKLEVNTDADLGFMRWLTVNVPGDPDHKILLEKPGTPAHDEATAEQIRDLVTKGAMGAAGIFTVDDLHKTYEELLAKGVEFTEEPTERFHGTDCGLRDRSATTSASASPRRARSRCPTPPVRRREHLTRPRRLPDATPQRCRAECHLRAGSRRGDRPVRVPRHYRGAERPLPPRRRTGTPARRPGGDSERSRRRRRRGRAR